MCSLMGKSLAVFKKSCLSIHSFLVKVQKYGVLKKHGFEWSFISNLSAVGYKLI